jgi:hypothetical protein
MFPSIDFKGISATLNRLKITVQIVEIPCLAISRNFIYEFLTSRLPSQRVF